MGPGRHQAGGVEGEREFRHVSILVVFGEAHHSYPNSCSNPTFSYFLPPSPNIFPTSPPPSPNLPLTFKGECLWTFSESQ